jgi:cystathionine beta-lyase
MDVNLADPIREALEAAVRSGDMGYHGGGDYIDAFVDFARGRWTWPELSGAAVQPASSVIQAYTDALLLAAGPQGAVVVTAPVYPPFYSYLRAAGLTVIEAALSADMRLDLHQVEHAISQGQADGRPTALLLCNPHNPGGTVHTRNELADLAALVQSHGVRVVSDEIHAPIVYAGHEFVPYVTVDRTALAVHSASKAWNLPAVPAALLVAGSEATDLLDAYRAGAHHWPSHLGAIAQTAAYRDGGEWLGALLTGLDGNRHFLQELLAARIPQVTMVLPESTYLAWLDCAALGLGEDPALAFLERGRVALNQGHTFGTGGQGHVRLNFATSQAILTQAVDRMASVVGH